MEYGSGLDRTVPEDQCVLEADLPIRHFGNRIPGDLDGFTIDHPDPDGATSLAV